MSTLWTFSRTGHGHGHVTAADADLSATVKNAPVMSLTPCRLSFSCPQAEPRRAGLPKPQRPPQSAGLAGRHFALRPPIPLLCLGSRFRRLRGAQLLPQTLRVPWRARAFGRRIPRLIFRRPLSRSCRPRGGARLFWRGRNCCF